MEINRGEKALIVWDYLLGLPMNVEKSMDDLNFKSDTGKDLFIEATKLYIDLGIDQENGFVINFSDNTYSKFKKFKA